jgi:hypothetical protein
MSSSAHLERESLSRQLASEKSRAAALWREKEDATNQCDTKEAELARSRKEATDNAKLLFQAQRSVELLGVELKVANVSMTNSRNGM